MKYRIFSFDFDALNGLESDLDTLVSTLQFIFKNNKQYRFDGFDKTKTGKRYYHFFDKKGHDNIIVIEPIKGE